jgi:hypothetical protein
MMNNDEANKEQWRDKHSDVCINTPTKLHKLQGLSKWPDNVNHEISRRASIQDVMDNLNSSLPAGFHHKCEEKIHGIDGEWFHTTSIKAVGIDAAGNVIYGDGSDGSDDSDSVSDDNMVILHTYLPENAD